MHSSAIPDGGIRPAEKAAFRFKEQCDIPVYVFGGINREIYSMPGEKMGQALVSEIFRLKDMECAGIKMLEGKPSVRKKIYTYNFLEFIRK